MKDIQFEEGSELEINKGSVYAGQFDDDQWYRVQISRKANKEGTEYEALFIDFGNKSILPLSKIKALPEELSRLAPVAHFCVLAGCTAPKGTSQYSDGSTQALGDAVFDAEVTANIVANDGERLHVSLVGTDSNSIEQKLLEQGRIRVLRRPFKDIPRAYVDKLKGFEETAIRNFVNIWEYGNVSDEEESARDSEGRVPLRTK